MIVESTSRAPIRFKVAEQVGVSCPPSFQNSQDILAVGIIQGTDSIAPGHETESE